MHWNVVVAAALLVGTASFWAGATWGAIEERAQDAPRVATAAAPVPSAGAVVAEDPAGDAVDLGLTRLTYGPGCRIGCIIPPATVDPVGTDAAFLDITRVAFDGEDADSFRVSLEIAALTEGFPELEARGVNRIAEYRVCWTAAEDAPLRCALLTAWTDHAESIVSSTFHVFAESCNDWQECAYEIPSEVTYGEPGAIRFTIPKRYAAIDGAPLAIASMRANTGWYATNEAAPLWHGAYSLRQGGEHKHTHAGVFEPEHRADETDAAAVGVLLAPGDGTWMPDPDEPTLVTSHGALWGAGPVRDMPELDLLAVDLWEEGADTLVVDYTLRAFEKVPAYGFEYITLIGREGGVMHEVGVLGEVGAQPVGYAGHCIAFECHDAWIDEVPLEIVAGSPGHVIIRVPKALLSDPQPGEETNFLWAITAQAELGVYVGDYGSAENANVHSESLVDAHLGGHPFVFGAGHKAASDEHAHGH